MKHIIIILLAAVLVGCSNQEETENDIHTESNTITEENSSVNFRNIDMKVEKNVMTMIGEANASEGEIYYRLELGEEVLLEESRIALDDSHFGWSDFEIELELPEAATEKEETPIVLLYGKNSDDEIVNPNHLPIDLNN